MNRLSLALGLLIATAPALASAQDTPPIPSEPAPPKIIIVPVDPQQEAPPAPMVVPLPKEESAQAAPTIVPVKPEPPPGVPAAPASDAPTAEAAVTDPEGPPPPALPPEPAAPADSAAMLDGHVREGAFLSGPGSLTFVLHHTLMLGLGGLMTQLANSDFRFDLASRELMLIGGLAGVGVGFGLSAWWQFNHWIGRPAATFGIVNSVISGMFLTGVVHLFNKNPTVLTWSALGGAELGAWLTATLGTGELSMSKGLFIASGGGWGLIYGALMWAIINTSSSAAPNGNALIDTLLIAPGIGAGALALAGLKYEPTTTQILRADLFGAGVGGAVLVLSALVLGLRFDIPTPYVLSLLSSAGAIAAVSLLWEEAAEKPVALYRDPEKDRPYRNVWW